MRRIAALLSVPLLATLALAGCGSATSSSSPSVSVKGQFGSDPTVSIPSQTAGKALAVKTLIKGNGPALTKTDAFVGNYAVYIWSGKTHKLAESTFQSKSPALFSGQLLPGLETALQGKKMGSRVLAVIPPAQGYGKSGNSQAGVKRERHPGVRGGHDQGVREQRVRLRQQRVQRRRLAAQRHGQGRGGPDHHHPEVREAAHRAGGQDPGQGERPRGGQGPDRRQPVRGRDLAERQGLRLVVVAGHAVRLHDRCHPQPGHHGLGHRASSGRQSAAG